VRRAIAIPCPYNSSTIRSSGEDFVLLAIDQGLDAEPNRLRGKGISAARRCDGGCEKILELEHAARTLQILVRGDSAHSAFVHADFGGDVAQHERLKMLNPVAKEGVLLSDDLARHLEDGSGALMQRLDEPPGLLMTFDDIIALGLAARPPVDRGENNDR